MISSYRLLKQIAEAVDQLFEHLNHMTRLVVEGHVVAYYCTEDDPSPNDPIW